MDREKFVELMSQGVKSFPIIRREYRWLVLQIVNRRIDNKDDFDEMVNAGDTGIMKAIKKFVKSKAGSDITYLSKYIEPEIIKSIYDKKSIRIPDYTMRKIKRIHKVRNDLFIKLEREPTTAEIGEEMKLSVEDIEKLLNFKFKKAKNKKRENIEEDDDGLENREMDGFEEASMQDYYNVSDKPLKNYIQLLSKEEQYILGYYDKSKIKIDDSVKRKKLGLSEGQLDRQKRQIKDKLKLMRAMDGGKVSIKLDSQKKSKKKKKTEPVSNTESEDKFLERVSKVAFRLFPDHFAYSKKLKDDDGLLKYINLSREPHNVTVLKSGELSLKLKKEITSSKIPHSIKYLSSFRIETMNKDKKVIPQIIVYHGLPYRITLMDFAKVFSPLVYKHQMEEFFRVLRILPGTIGNYCNEKKEGVDFKKDNLESFYEKLDAYIEDTEDQKIDFSDLKKITGKTVKQIFKIEKDGRLIFPYKIIYSKERLVRRL